MKGNLPALLREAASMTRRGLRLSGAFVAVLTLAMVRCGDAPPREGGPATFRPALVGVPGGSFLAVWGDGEGRRAFLAEGLVGVDPARVPGGQAGRLVEYQWPGRFTTRCMADSALWWVSGARTAGGELVLWAVGDRGRVVRFRGERCESLSTGLRFEGGDPTFWGVLAQPSGEVWVVGGSPRPDGPRGVLLRGDGASWRQEPLPESAAQENLYKIAADGEALYVVGSGGLVLRREPLDGTWRRVEVRVRTSDSRLFTVSCAGGSCFAVGGSASALLMRGRGTDWAPVDRLGDTPLDELTGLNGVWARGADDVLLVGVDGLTAHTDGRSLSFGSPRGTEATLHAVGGFDDVALAVGGELDNASPSQRGVVLVRGDGASVFTLDGRQYAAPGGLLRSRGGAGQ